MAKKQEKNEKLLNEMEFAFDEFLAELRDTNKNGKFLKKHEMAVRTLTQMIRNTASDFQPKGPLVW